jgi:cytidylate kinase
MIGGLIMSDKTTITICREYCSGGHEIGKKLAEKLGYEFYDKELITLAARECGYSEKIFERVDEVATNSLLYSLVLSAYGANSAGAMPDNDKLFGIQADIIRKVFKEQNCVIIGRCSDYILREEARAIKVFLRADMDFRIKRYERLYETPNGKTPEQMISKIDKKRSTYHKFYTGEGWDDLKNYDIVINTAKVGIDGAVEMICEYLNRTKN